MNKIIFILSLLIILGSCINNSQKPQHISLKDSINSKYSNTSADSMKVINPQPKIVSFYQSECQGNCKATKLVVGKIWSNDTLWIRLASYLDCKNKFVCNINFTNDTLEFNISTKPIITIIKNKGKSDTIYDYKTHACDCFYFFDICIAGINKIPEKILLNGVDHIIGGMVISDTLEFKIEDKQIDEKKDSLPPPYIVVEEMPSYPGGDEARIKFIMDNLNFPPHKKDEIPERTSIFVTFVVEPDGTLTNIKVLRGMGKDYDEEAVRVIKMMPKWNPGRQSGKNVRVQFSLPIRVDFN